MHAVSVLASALFAATAAHADITPIDCDSCAEWNREHAPFRLFGNSYYVGTEGLSSVLIATDQGLVLIDGALPQSAPQIARNIEALGFKLSELKWIVNSHAHFDHAGGIAALARMSGARVAASERGAEALRLGNASDDGPQAGFGKAAMAFPPVAEVTVVADGEAIRLGNLELTAHYMPGHTPGAASWHWRSCEAEHCLNLVYADSLTPVAAPGFRYSSDPARVAAFEHSIERMRELPCDLFVAAHPSFAQLFERQAAGTLVEAHGCRNYADDAAQRLQRRLAEESSGT